MYEAISGLALTAGNYREAVDILKKRFGNREHIISKHMDALLNVETVTSPHNLKGLRQLYDKVESYIRSLNTLGVTADSYGSLLASALLTCHSPVLLLSSGALLNDLPDCDPGRGTKTIA